jgi:isopentenyl-diphosphate Delta-isomerase
MGNRIQKDTSVRKMEHVSIVLNEDAGFRKKTSGFNEFEFEHNALPELNSSEIDTSSEFLGKKLEFPYMISCMTGGYTNSYAINKLLASVCEERKIAFGVGSQRQALENRKFHKTYQVVRKFAPTIPIIGNIGANELVKLKNVGPIEALVDMIDADAIAIHLNPLQEYLQMEGNTNFSGVLNSIESLVTVLKVPIIVKEVGAGISAQVAKKIMNIGVNIVDVAGAGGTSWAGIEIIRSGNQLLSEAFWDWGIPTAEAIINIRKLSKQVFIIGSGGIRSGTDIAKSISLGANMAASATPMLEALNKGGKKEVHKVLDIWEKELRGIMFLTGSRNISNLRKTKLVKVS